MFSAPDIYYQIKICPYNGFTGNFQLDLLSKWEQIAAQQILQYSRSKTKTAMKQAKTYFIPVFEQAIKFLIASLTGFIFHMLNIPSAWVLGAMVGTIGWSLTGYCKPMPIWLRNTALLISGIAMGQSMTPETLVAIRHYPLSLSILMLSVLLTTCFSSLWLIRKGGWNRTDALLASVPGGLGAIIAIAGDSSKRVADIVMIQSFRLFAVIGIIPVIAAFSSGQTASMFPGAGKPIISLEYMLLLFITGALSGYIFQKLKIAASFMIGGLFVSLIVHVSGWTDGVNPPFLALSGLILIGSYTGERFSQIRKATLLNVINLASVSFLIQFLLAGVFAVSAAYVANASFLDALLAFAPGGQEAMSMLALTLGLNPLFVMVHHLTRFFAITLSLPFWVSWLGKKDQI